jgi:hypothetical protein
MINILGDIIFEMRKNFSAIRKIVTIIKTKIALPTHAKTTLYVSIKEIINVR